MSVSVGGRKLYSIPPPGSGPVLAFILNILDAAGVSKKTATSYQQMVEAFKFTYARRLEMGDEDFVDMTKVFNDDDSVDQGRFPQSFIICKLFYILNNTCI